MYFSTVVKGGKVLTFELTGETESILRRAAIWRKQPFRDIKPVSVYMVLKRITSKLVNQGKIRYPYTTHDFRYFFACSFYRETGDIVRLCRMLGHSTINMTDIYLQSVGVK